MRIRIIEIEYVRLQTNHGCVKTQNTKPSLTTYENKRELCCVENVLFLK